MYHSALVLRYEKERDALTLATVLWWLAVGILAVFIPIYLLNTGYTLSWIFIFFGIVHFIRFVNVPLSMMLIGRIGAKHVFSGAFLFLILFYLAFNMVDVSRVYFYLAAIFSGLATAYTWTAYHLHTSKIVPDGRRGRTLATYRIFQSLALAPGPILGGILLERYGIHVPVTLAVILVFLAAATLLQSKEISTIHTLNFHRIKFRTIWRDALANGLNNLRGTLNEVIWPLFLFYIVDTYTGVGYIEGLALLFGIILIFVIGNLVDRYARKKILLTTSVLYAVVAIARALVSTALAALTLNVLYIINLHSYLLVWDSIFHHNASKHPRAEYLMWFESAGGFVTSIGMLLFAGLALVVDIKTMLVGGLVTAGLLALTSNMIEYRGRDIGTKAVRAS